MDRTEDILYGLMDWAEIETIMYSEHDNPHSILGPHVINDRFIVNAFVPDVESVIVKVDGEEYKAVLEDEGGFYSCLIKGNTIRDYSIKVIDSMKGVSEFKDPYSFGPIMTEDELHAFNNGRNYSIYELLGCHIREVNGVKGLHFAVWAPFAIRVSVVGEFNKWDGRIHQMRKLGSSGVFELFIPGLGEGILYKYEIKAKGSLTYLKADPYANESELRPNTASISTDLKKYEWTDQKWMEDRKNNHFDKKPMFVYEVHLGSFKKPSEEDGSFYNYRELAVMLADYVMEMGYTHIELMPVMEHPLDASWGYQVTGYYSATKRYGTPEDFMYFMDYMHNKGIGVILDWVPAHFPRDNFGLAAFDGTCLYEHLDPRQGAHPHWGTLIYNYKRPEVANFLIANALFWVEKYHVDGIRMDAVASMLYLDYGKNHGEWVANEDGGNENYEAIEFLKHLSDVFHKMNNGAILIAEESTAWPNITSSIEDGGLGFDFKWNMGWMNDFTFYMKRDPLFRKGCHGALTFSMVYAYSEKFQLVFSHDEVVHMKGSMLTKMPGDMKDKFANLRLAYGFMTAHPGKKLLFMGQDFGQIREWSETRSLDWHLLNEDRHIKLNHYMKALMKLYHNQPALFALDFDPKGFAWVSALDADHSIISFMRKTNKKKEALFIICNFTPVIYKNQTTAVPYEGKYKEIFNSDMEEFGGDGVTNPRVKNTKKMQIHGQKQAIDINIPSLGIAVFTYSSTQKKDSETEVVNEVKEENTNNKKTSLSKKNKAAKTKNTKAKNTKTKKAKNKA